MRPALFATALASTVAATAIAQSADPFLWLEEIEGAKPLEQVKAWNAETENVLTNMPGYAERQARALKILQDPEQIAMPSAVIGDKVLNHWVDANHKRGLWRVASLDSYISGKPDWRVLIDVDALGKAEGKSWVWHGANCLAPEYKRCLVALSPGGTDADVVREFDFETGKIVEGGFVVPEGKNDATWVDQDTLLVARVEGEGTATRSGYPRIVKRWKRGTPWASATTVLEGVEADISVGGYTTMDGDKRRVFVRRGNGFFTAQWSLLGADGKAIRLPIPESAEFNDVIGGKAIVSLVDPLGSFQPGDLVAFDLDRPDAAPTLVMRPTASQSIEQVSASDNVLWVKLLDDVSGKLLALTPGDGGRWAQRTIDLPANSTISLGATAGKKDVAFASVEGMLTPTTLMAVNADGTSKQVAALPAQFDSSKFAVQQNFATSKDGTKVPYFLVRKKLGSEHPVPTLIHAYGGFRAAQTPTYLTGQPYRAGPLGLFWAEDGGAYVLANIRGGGEYGPAWHKAALREKRQNSFDDLEAVARDLIAKGIARKDGIAISGRSNGGVLTGAAITQHPDLYRAAIIGSPLFDMKRYSHLSAGASWIDEYGDPDKPADWSFMSKYSPYQSIKPNVRYPATFFYLSTKDDRVHPGHARKGAAKLKATGSTVYYHEYLEGGHSVGADRAEDAKRAALLWAFLTRELAPRK
ncbi:prolyl oligopeptidase family serine peptidase [Sphingomonas sp. HDW15A]|uniref:prolyl oligopeptidase family serine peptidase n=1 Tax=Sphingomonas sp. HDW15A TaxID=2714942 RepID=UPI001F0EBEC8|nr:prolyl oligopeptidase family serine peptidase [Sphingomonas sp. HDW15A]